MTDTKIISDIKAGGSQEDRALNKLYVQEYPKISRLLKKHGARRVQCKDIFQDALIVFYEKVKEGSFKEGASISAFLSVVARNIFLTQAKREKRILSVDQELEMKIDDTQQIQSVMESRELSGFIQKLLVDLKEDCKKILTLAIYERLPMDEIAKQMGFLNSQIARNKKYKCLNHLKKIILGSNSIKNLLGEFRI